MKRLLIVSDLHCGHRYGLTPPDWWSPEDTGPGKVQRVVWGFWQDLLKKLPKLDLVVCNGDAIDGAGRINQGVELLTTDRLTQVDMATQILEGTGAGKFGIIRGSGYHTGQAEDFENVLADNLDASFLEDHAWVDLEGVVFDFKHEVGNTSIPHGKASAINKEMLWALLHRERGLGPKVDVLVRSHVHRFHVTLDEDGMRMTTPAFQLWSNYGVRKFSSTISLGAVYFEVSKGAYDWKPYLLNLEFAKREAIKL